MSQVLLYRLSAPYSKEEILIGIETIFKRMGFGERFGKDGLCAVKIHFGEKGNDNHIPSEHASKVIELLKGSGAKPFLTDANTIYRGERANSVDHLELAYEHGFLPSVVGAPVIIADGLTGKDYRKILIDGKHFREIKVATAALDASSMFVLTHFKGHMLAGFGGTLKNMGMGLASRSGKQEQHSDLKPVVDTENCIGCFACRDVCPADAVRDSGGRALIDHSACIGCGECTASCTTGAIRVRWKTDNRTFQEKMIEYASGIIRTFGDRIGYINFLVNVVPHCDCMEMSDPPVVDDIGILSSDDPVALDRACVDLVNAENGLPSSNFGKGFDAIPAGRDKFGKIHGVRWQWQLDHAEKLGLGSQRYELIRIEADAILREL